MYVGDIYTLEIKVDRGKNEVGYVHSQRLPFLKLESLHFFILDHTSSSLLFHKEITRPERVTTESFQNPAMLAGTFKFKTMLISDSYIGLDEQLEFEMEVLPAELKPQVEYRVHPDDAKALKQPSFLASMFKEALANNKEIDSDNELEDYDTQEIKKQVRSMAAESNDGEEKELPEEKAN